jgi:hypothetical protein
VETGLSHLDRARDIVEVLPKGEVSLVPGNHLFVGNWYQILFFDDFVPDWSFVRHIRCKRERNRVRGISRGSSSRAGVL